MFLPQKHGREVLVRYPNGAIMPGEVGELTIQYYTSETGSFSETIEVYTNASIKAEKLTLKGNIKSIYANALTACPSFHDAPAAKGSDPNVIQTVDVATNRPIPNVQIEVYDRGIRKAVNGTTLDGVAVNWIEPGKYVAVASKSGYEKAEQDIAFTKRERIQVVYMKRSVAAPILEEEFIVASVSDRWKEPVEKVSEDRFQELEPKENLVLGIRTNEQFEESKTSSEQEIDLGVKTNDVIASSIPKKETAVLNLGINSNQQWDELSLEVNQEKSEEAIDLGIQSNDQLSETIGSSQIERQVEAALADAQVVEAPKELKVEPEFSSEKFRPNNLLLLLDVSGSMKDDDKMDKLKSAIRRLVMMLREVDVLTMIAYNSDSWELLPPTPVRDNKAIVALVDSLQPFGYTNGVKGMETAYKSLQSQLIDGGNNQLIIATDGKFNSSRFSEQEALQLVKDNSDKGIVLSIIGFGDDKEAGRLMKKLANLGAGNFMQISNDEDPTELLAEEIKLRSQK